MTTSTGTVLPHTSEAPPAMQMMEMLYGSLATQMLSVAAELGIADLLAGGPRPVEELAAQTGTDANALYRTMRGLATLGAFTETAPRVFGLTPLASTLRSDVPDSMRDLARDVGGLTRHRAYAELAYSVRTGRPAFDKALGAGMWDYLTAHPEEAALFGSAMGNLASQAHAAAFSAYDLSDVRRLVDMGGGEGYLLAAILPRYPEMHGVVFDAPHVVKGAEKVFTRAGIAERAESVAGDIFQSAPADGDAYVLSSILFSYDDVEARTVLANIRRVMNPAGKILVLEPILPDGDEPHPGKLLDVVQLALHRGGVRSKDAFAALFESAGLRIDETRTMWPSSPTDLITAVPA
jgi:SAM-dependent methyltransferase